MLKFSTFSIAARCDRTGMLGVAVSTAVPAVGALCPHARAGLGAISTQSFNNPYFGIDGIRLLAEGLSSEEVISRLIAGDPDRELRQVIAVDAAGRPAAFTGKECVAWNGQITGPNYAVAGNMLTGPETIQAMASAFESNADKELPERLMRVLEAGQAAGGDKRGRQSASLLVVHREEYPYCDLRVDEHADPVAELRRILEVAKVQLFPFVSTMPTRDNPAGRRDDRVTADLLVPVTERPTHP